MTPPTTAALPIQPSAAPYAITAPYRLLKRLT
jgi:hypothetical protein